MAVRWAWSLGAAREEGPVDAGHGLKLPLASESVDPPGWWGSLFLLVADATLLGSLLFGYAFLWTVAPNWPPPAWLGPGVAGPALALGARRCPLGGIRLADLRLRQARGPWIGLLAGILGCGALALAAATVLLGTEPRTHAYDAMLWVLGGYVLLHAGVAGLMTAYLAARSAAGYVTGSRIGEARVVRLWVDYAAGTGLIALAAAWLPGLLG